MNAFSFMEFYWLRIEQKAVLINVWVLINEIVNSY